VVTALTRDLCRLALRLTAALIHPVGRMREQNDMAFFKALLYELCRAKLLLLLLLLLLLIIIIIIIIITSKCKRTELSPITNQTL